MEEKKKTAREIIEGYQGPPVRIMEVCGTHTHEDPQASATAGGADFRPGLPGLCNTGRLY